jgi:NIMA-interacting peptidyl-prolyl cis-trans isomerase 1
MDRLDSLSRSALVVLVVVLAGSAGCQCGQGGAPSPSGATTVTSSAPASSAAALAASSGEPAASAPAPMVSAPPREIAGAQQVLVAYKGAELAPKGVVRSKAEAKRVAEEALKKIKKDNVAFEEVAKKYSDDEVSKGAGGAIGNFERNAMPEAFSKVAFELKVGDVSDVVETPRGYHIIKRTR